MIAACIFVSPFYKGQFGLDMVRLGRVCLLYLGRNFLRAVLTDNSCKVLGLKSFFFFFSFFNLARSSLGTADLNLSPEKMNDREAIKAGKEYNHSNVML